VESGGRKKGGKALVTGNSPRWSPDDRGALRAVGVARERREEKRGLSAFCAEATHAPGGGKGGVQHGRATQRRAGRGPAWAQRTAREGPGGAETRARQGRRRAGDAGDAGTEQGREASTGGPARRVGPRRRDREEGREGDRWAWFFKFNPNSMIQTG
jgi:hypothetical protein